MVYCAYVLFFLLSVGVNAATQQECEVAQAPRKLLSFLDDSHYASVMQYLDIATHSDVALKSMLKQRLMVVFQYIDQHCAQAYDCQIYSHDITLDNTKRQVGVVRCSNGNAVFLLSSEMPDAMHNIFHRIAASRESESKSLLLALLSNAQMLPEKFCPYNDGELDYRLCDLGFNS